jgi:hypothetical protein
MVDVVGDNGDGLARVGVANFWPAVAVCTRVGGLILKELE